MPELDHQAPVAVSPAHPASIVREDPDLQSRYEEYCRRQAKGLLSILPREAIRPFYARARAWGRESGMEVEKDPLATFLLFIQKLMPLPPLEVWGRDRVRHMDAHIQEEFDSPAAYRSSSPPVTVESRGLEWNGDRWRATLKIFRSREAWRGLIVFNRPEDSKEVRTAEIFREEDPDEIRNRFRGFQNHTLQAFLRSVLP